MKKILIVYTKMIIGGSTTSLLSILNHIDYEKYSVDLMLYEHGGELFDRIPNQVNILTEGNIYKKHSKLLMIKRIIKPTYLYDFIRSRYLSKKMKNPLIRQQIMSYQSARFCNGLDDDYDVAIGFLEFWPTIYVSEKIKAKRKLTWIHVDYVETGLIAELDRQCFAKFDGIVLVSEPCRINFNVSFPELSIKTYTIQNILSQTTIKQMADKDAVDFDVSRKDINFVTVCRLVFSHKGLDRGVKAFKRIVDIIPDLNFKWYIIGEGPDEVALTRMIDENGLNDKIVLLGKKVNPFPYIKKMDVFLLPSHYEGKPMAVTEALMLGIVPFVTNYSSAREQIISGEDGIIVENNDEALFEGLYNLVSNPQLIQEIKKSINAKDYSNVKEIVKIINLVEGKEKV